MNTKLLILACAMACASAQETTPKAEPKKFDATDGGNITTSDSSKLFLKESTSHILLMQTTEPNYMFGDVVTITGIEGRMVAPPPDGVGLYFIRGPVAERPEKPEQIVVLLKTKDGKLWRASWVEDKPTATKTPSTPHIHQWGKWSEPKETSNWYVGTFFSQTRNCETCGQAEMKEVQVSQHSNK